MTDSTLNPQTNPDESKTPNLARFKLSIAESSRIAEQERIALAIEKRQQEINKNPSKFFEKELKAKVLKASKSLKLKRIGISKQIKQLIAFIEKIKPIVLNSTSLEFSSPITIWGDKIILQYDKINLSIEGLENIRCKMEKESYIYVEYNINRKFEEITKIIENHLIK